MMMCTYTSVFWHIRARRGSALRHKSDVYGYANTDDYCPYRRGDFVAVPSSTGNARATVCRTVAYNVPTLFRFYVYIRNHLIKRGQRKLACYAEREDGRMESKKEYLRHQRNLRAVDVSRRFRLESFFSRPQGNTGEGHAKPEKAQPTTRYELDNQPLRSQ